MNKQIENQTRMTITVTPEQAKYLKARGNISRYVRELIEHDKAAMEKAILDYNEAIIKEFSRKVTAGIKDVVNEVFARKQGNEDV